LYGRTVGILGPQRAHRAGRRRSLSPARREVLDLLLDADGGMTVAEVAAVIGAHPNTAREHLDALVQAGDLVRAQLPAVGRGRPPMIYRAVPNERDVGPEYRMLAEVLVRVVAELCTDHEEQRARAISAGEAWARRATAERGRDRMLCLSMLDAEPVPAGDGDDVTLRVRRCPVLDLAREYPDIVCFAHLGVLRGCLVDDELADQVTLEPFAEPGACLLHLPGVAPQVEPALAAGLATRVPGAVAGVGVAPAPAAAEGGTLAARMAAAPATRMAAAPAAASGCSPEDVIGPEDPSATVGALSSGPLVGARGA
jgi:predicted ArsR family transcriptional regulator